MRHGRLSKNVQVEDPLIQPLPQIATDYDQAVKWTFVKKSRINSDKLIFRYVNEFEYNEDNDLNVLNFLTASEKWLDFVYANRKDDNFTHEYDVVMGPVADDTLYKVLDLYDSGVLTYKETIERLKTYKLSNQISFHTEKSLKYLKYIYTNIYNFLIK